MKVLEFLEATATAAAAAATSAAGVQDPTEIQGARFKAIQGINAEDFKAKGIPVWMTRHTEYLGSILQLKIKIPKMPCRKVILPATHPDGTPRKIFLNIRHTKAPGLAFMAPLDEETKTYMTDTTTHLMTVRYGTPERCVVGLGTGYAGSDDEDEWPGLESTPYGEGILYKWYPSEETRTKDAALFKESIRTFVPALVDPLALRDLVMA